MLKTLVRSLFSALWIFTYALFPVANVYAETPLTPTEIEGRVRSIATITSDQFKDLFIVNHASVYTHVNPVSRGVQYSMVITKFVDSLKETDSKAVGEVVGILLKYTTVQILTQDPELSYVAVQIIHPNMWAVGFGGAGELYGYADLYVAKRDELMALLELENNKKNPKWIYAAEQFTLELIESDILAHLLTSIQQKDKKEKGFSIK